MFEQFGQLLKTLVDFSQELDYAALAASSSLTTVVALHRFFRKKEAAAWRYADDQKRLRESAEKLAKIDADQSEQLTNELERVSAPRALAFAKEQLAHGNDGSVFDRLSLFLTENSDPVAAICAHVAEIRLVRSMATKRDDNLREVFRLATVAHKLDPRRKRHRDLYVELEALLIDQSVTEGTVESQHDIFEWLHLRDIDEVIQTVRTLPTLLLMRAGGAVSDYCVSVGLGQRRAGKPARGASDRAKQQLFGIRKTPRLQGRL
jgi:hypothetical protein